MVLALYKNYSKTKVYVTTILGNMFLIAIVVGFTYLIAKYRDRLERSDLKEKIGTLYMGINTKSRVATYYSVVFIVRRFFYAIVSTCAGNFDGGLTLCLVVTISMGYSFYCI